MKLLGLFIPSLIFLLSCSVNDDPKEKLATLYKKFDEKHVSHFPRGKAYGLKKYSYLVPLEGIDDNKGAYLKVMYALSQNEFERLERQSREKAIKICHHLDECNVLIERGSQLYNPELELCDTVYPVPVFLEEMDYFDVLDYSSLPDEFKLYIIEAKEGLFLQSDFLSDEMTMTSDWQHGLSKGVALNKEKLIAIFWIDIW